MDSHQYNETDLFEIFSNMPVIQVIFLTLAFITWIGGGNLLLKKHLRRINKYRSEPLEEFDVLNSLFKTYNKKEWLTFILLFVLSAMFGIAALYIK